jgi:hypothetical protein
MWAHCSDGMSASCINGATTCIYIDDPQMPDGYCSTSGCQMPAVDCDPVPTDATSPATCINAKDTNDNDVPICALDCGLAQTCPAGMVCTGITFDGGTTNYDICV